MKIYVHDNGVILSGKTWEIQQKLKEYAKDYQLVSDWVLNHKKMHTLSCWKTSSWPEENAVFKVLSSQYGQILAKMSFYGALTPNYEYDIDNRWRMMLFAEETIGYIRFICFSAWVRLYVIGNGSENKAESDCEDCCRRRNQLF